MTSNQTTKLEAAAFGSISHGTLRTPDLLSAFLAELEYQQRRNDAFLSQPENFALRDRIANAIGEAQDCFDEDDEDIAEGKEDAAAELVNETLPDLLTEFAPAYGYFGTHPGDGTDFGFGVDVENVKEQVEFVSSREQEYPPEDFRGEWLHVNDHGNCTLYVRGSDGKDVELWSVV